MTLTFGTILQAYGIALDEVLVLRHAFVGVHADTGLPGIHADSTETEILAYTSQQTARPGGFTAAPPRFWVAFMPEGGDRARFWRVLENRGEIGNDGLQRSFDLVISDGMADLRDRLVIGWRAPRSWRLHGPTAARYPVLEIADARPVRFPGFDWLVLDYPRLQAVMREHRYATWRTALSSVLGIYLITDTRDGRQYVGKADGAESILQRWREYALSGHGGNVQLRGLDPSTFRLSILRVFDPATPVSVINEAESHFKRILGTREHGLNGN